MLFPAVVLLASGLLRSERRSAEAGGEAPAGLQALELLSRPLVQRAAAFAARTPKGGGRKGAEAKAAAPANPFASFSFGAKNAEPEEASAAPANPFAGLSFGAKNAEPEEASAPKAANPFAGLSFGGKGAQPDSDPEPDLPPAEAELPEPGPGLLPDGSGVITGAGLAGAGVGAILADAAVTASSTALSGELLTDAAALGAVALGAGAAYAATRPDEAGEAARFVGGAVRDTTQAYAELAAVNAELAVLKQRQAAQAAVDETVAKAVALPGEVVESVAAAPRNLYTSVTDQIRAKLEAAQADLQAELNSVKRETEDMDQ